MDLNKCDSCGNRHIMCCFCEKNNQYRKTDNSHDKYVRNKAIDEFFEALKEHYRKYRTVPSIYVIDEMVEKMKGV